MEPTRLQTETELSLRFRPLKHHSSKSQKTMGSRALLLLKATTADALLFTSKSAFSKPLLIIRNPTRRFSTRSALLPPDLPRLAETARISLTPQEVRYLNSPFLNPRFWFWFWKCFSCFSKRNKKRKNEEEEVDFFFLVCFCRLRNLLRKFGK